MADYVLRAARWKKTTVNIDLDQLHWCKAVGVDVTKLLKVSIQNLKEDIEKGDSRSEMESRLEILSMRHQFLMDKFAESHSPEVMTRLLKEMEKEIELKGA